MTKKEYKIVKEIISHLVGGRHGCALKAPLHPDDKKRGLKVGQFCDVCTNEIKHYLSLLTIH